MQLSTEMAGVDEALADLALVGENANDAIVAAMTRIALLGQREARRNAPRSPSMKILKALRKTKRKVTRNPRAVSRAKPGGLERSIEGEMIVGPNFTHVDAVVFVSANSEAGRYAAKVHDQKGVTWHTRGPGTVVKGDRADSLYIDRALRDNAGNFVDIIKDEQRKAVRV